MLPIVAALTLAPPGRAVLTRMTVRPATGPTPPGMRVRTGRFQLDSEPDVSILFFLGGGDFDLYPCRFAPNLSMLPIVAS